MLFTCENKMIKITTVINNALTNKIISKKSQKEGL